MTAARKETGRIGVQESPIGASGPWKNLERETPVKLLRRKGPGDIDAVVERCAGIDVGTKSLAVCVMTGPANGEARHEIRTFGTTVAELTRLKEWIVSEGCTQVVRESTGSYWKPVFNILEESVPVTLANPHEVKARKGHKTDHKDGWWLAHLLRHAMITPSFIPPCAQRELRDLTRRRKKLIQTATGKEPGG